MSPALKIAIALYKSFCFSSAPTTSVTWYIRSLSDPKQERTSCLPDFTEFLTRTFIRGALNMNFAGRFTTDSPEDFFRSLNRADPLRNGNWTVNIVDSNGKIIEENIDWRNIRLTLTLNEIFGIGF